MDEFVALLKNITSVSFAIVGAGLGVFYALRKATVGHRKGIKKAERKFGNNELRRELCKGDRRASLFYGWCLDNMVVVAAIVYFVFLCKLCYTVFNLGFEKVNTATVDKALFCMDHMFWLAVLIVIFFMLFALYCLVFVVSLKTLAKLNLLNHLADVGGEETRRKIKELSGKLTQ